MSYPEPSLAVEVDVSNPGQFFACCGILEVAHRLWPGAEGWFGPAKDAFSVSTRPHESDMERFISIIRECNLSALTELERGEREKLEKDKKRLKMLGKDLAPDKEERRSRLGTQARGGVLQIDGPIAMALDWWHTDDEPSPKTWAGRQELHRIARSAQDALAGITDPSRPFAYGCVLRMPREYSKGKVDNQASVEPFYFDARRFAHSLDTGFSLDVQNVETVAHPAVELLALIGLQRFRPATLAKWRFDYWVWFEPLGASVAGAVAACAVPTHAGQKYRFPLRFRDDQKRYKAFGFAVPMGDHA